MKRLALASLAFVAFALLVSGTAMAKPPLREHGYINDQLFAAAVADELRKRCSSVEARMVKVRTEALALYNYALRQGYSKAEISDYLESKEDNARMKQRRDRYLQSKGVKKGEEATYCRLGQEEIAAKSPIGSLLRSR